MAETGSGHRMVPHTADLRIEAWAPTREGCVAEAVRAAVETFVDLGGARASGVRRAALAADVDEDLLVAALEEMVYLLDTTGEVPVDVELTATSEGAEVTFGTTLVTDLEQIGAVPKAVSLHELRLGREEGPETPRWTCSVTLDV